GGMAAGGGAVGSLSAGSLSAGSLSAGSLSAGSLSAGGGELALLLDLATVLADKGGVGVGGIGVVGESADESTLAAVWGLAQLASAPDSSGAVSGGIFS